MSPASFTFLNVTGTPALSQSDSKLMRAHITKTNFANRRRRRTETGAATESAKRVALTGTGRGLLTKDELLAALPADLPLTTPPKDPHRYAQFRKNIEGLSKSAANCL